MQGMNSSNSYFKQDKRFDQSLQKQVQYWKQHPEEFIEFMYGVNFHLYQKLLIKMLWKE